MSEKPCAPETCQSMEEVRAGVDALDAELVSLLARRFAYMQAAARIKPDRGLVRDEARKAAVIAKASDMAAERGLPRDVIEGIWDSLVEGSIVYEMEAWDSARKTD